MKREKLVNYIFIGWIILAIIIGIAWFSGNLKFPSGKGPGIGRSLLGIDAKFKTDHGVYKLVNHVYHFEVTFPSSEKPEKIGHENIVGFQSIAGEGMYVVMLHDTKVKLTGNDVEDYLNAIAEAKIENRKNGKIVYKKRIIFKNMKAVKYKLAFELNAEPYYFYQTSISMVSNGKPYSITVMYPKKFADEVEPNIQPFFETFFEIKVSVQLECTFNGIIYCEAGIK